MFSKLRALHYTGAHAPRLSPAMEEDLLVLVAELLLNRIFTRVF